MDYSVITLKVPRRVKRRLERKAEEMGVTVSDILRTLIYEFLKGERKPEGVYTGGLPREQEELLHLAEDLLRELNEFKAKVKDVRDSVFAKYKVVE